MNESDELFDQALDLFLKDRGTSGELQSYSEAIRSLQTLERVPKRDRDRARIMRQDFLNQAASLKPTVSDSRDSRLNGWTSIFRKERSPMYAITRIITIAAILLGGTVGTAFAAQESLPDQALYPVKTLIEDVRLGLTSDPQAEFDLLMNYVEERIEEIEALIESGDPVNTAVQERLNNHLQAAFRNAAELNDPALLKAMERVREQSQLQLNIFNQLNQGNGVGPDGNLDLAEQAIIRSRIQAEDALEDPNTLRTRYSAERNEDAPDQPIVEPPGKQGRQPDDAGEGESSGPSNESGNHDGTQGPQRNGKNK
jgi:hypothetical protein